MINNFLCDRCSHALVCEKMKTVMKFHEEAKKDLLIEITMESCLDFNDELGNGNVEDDE